jgi:hypothetical protein
MRSSRVVRASDSQCLSRNCPGFDPSILRHRGICGAADEAVLNTGIVHKKIQKTALQKELKEHGAGKIVSNSQQFFFYL